MRRALGRDGARCGGLPFDPEVGPIGRDDLGSDALDEGQFVDRTERAVAGPVLDDGACPDFADALQFTGECGGVGGVQVDGLADLRSFMASFRRVARHIAAAER